MNKTAKKLIALLICTSALSSSIMGCGKNNSNDDVSKNTNSSSSAIKKDKVGDKVKEANNQKIENNTDEASKEASLESNYFNSIDNNKNNKSEKGTSNTDNIEKSTQRLHNNKNKTSINSLFKNVNSYKTISLKEKLKDDNSYGVTLEEQKILNKVPRAVETLLGIEELINNKIQFGIASDEDKKQLEEIKHLFNEVNTHTNLQGQLKYGEKVIEYVKSNNIDPGKISKENKKLIKEFNPYAEATPEEQKELKKIHASCETLLKFQELINNKIKLGIASDEDRQQLGETKELFNELKLHPDLSAYLKYGENIMMYIQDHNIDLNKIINKNKKITKELN